MNKFIIFYIEYDKPLKYSIVSIIISLLRLFMSKLISKKFLLINLTNIIIKKDFFQIIDINKILSCNWDYWRSLLSIKYSFSIMTNTDRFLFVLQLGVAAVMGLQKTQKAMIHQDDNISHLYARKKQHQRKQSRKLSQT
mgnify:CR=1 FL=1